MFEGVHADVNDLYFIDAHTYTQWLLTSVSLHPVASGRYRPGKDKPDPKTWKANFRCALNSLPDVCELHEHSRKRGNNAFRVYKMMPSAQPQRRRRGDAWMDEEHTQTGSAGAPVWAILWCAFSHSSVRLRAEAVQQIWRKASESTWCCWRCVPCLATLFHQNHLRPGAERGHTLRRLTWHLSNTQWGPVLLLSLLLFLPAVW